MSAEEQSPEMPAEEIVDGEAVSTELVEVTEAHEGTAAAKLMATLRAISKPPEDADELQLMLASVAMGLENALAGELERTQATGELDDFIAGLVRWLAQHRSDTVKRLVVVEMPRRRELPAGKRLQLLDEAEYLAEHATSPLP